MKDTPANQELFEYYNERAPEYEAFYYGKFPTSRQQNNIYLEDRQPIQSLIAEYINGKCIDIACGTGFWLPFYEKNCPSITLIDQSDNMLAECSKKIHDLGIEGKTSVIQENIFSPALTAHSYDSALIGFLISHFTDTELADFFKTLKTVLKTSGSFVIIDSAWSEEVQKSRLVKKGMNKRELFDGRKFEIYKRFFEKRDLDKIADKYKINLEIIYRGKVFFMAAGRFNDMPA